MKRSSTTSGRGSRRPSLAIRHLSTALILTGSLVLSGTAISQSYSFDAKPAWQGSARLNTTTYSGDLDAQNAARGALGIGLSLEVTRNLNDIMGVSVVGHFLRHPRLDDPRRLRPALQVLFRVTQPRGRRTAPYVHAGGNFVGSNGLGFGPAIGAGLDYRLTKNVSLFAEGNVNMVTPGDVLDASSEGANYDVMGLFGFGLRATDLRGFFRGRPTVSVDRIRVVPPITVGDHTLEAEANIDAPGATFAWDFGDGTFGEGNPVQHRFPGDAVYPVTVTVTTRANGTATREMPVQIGGTPPPAEPGFETLSVDPRPALVSETDLDSTQVGSLAHAWAKRPDAEAIAQAAQERRRVDQLRREQEARSAAELAAKEAAARKLAEENERMAEEPTISPEEQAREIEAQRKADEELRARAAALEAERTENAAQAERERIAAAERLAEENAKAEQDRIAAERLEEEKAEAERLRVAAEEAEKTRLADAEAEQKRLADEAEAARLAEEQRAAAARAALEKEKAEEEALARRLLEEKAAEEEQQRLAEEARIAEEKKAEADRKLKEATERLRAQRMAEVESESPEETPAPISEVETKAEQDIQAERQRISTERDRQLEIRKRRQEALERARAQREQQEAGTDDIPPTTAKPVDPLPDPPAVQREDEEAAARKAEEERRAALAKAAEEEREREAEEARAAAEKKRAEEARAAAAKAEAERARREAPPLPPGENPFANDMPQDQPAFTWVVASRPTRMAAENIADLYRFDGVKCRVYSGEVNNTIVYRVALGAFPSREQAQASRPYLPERAPSDSWLLVR